MKRISSFIRWMARILGALMVLLVVRDGRREGLPSLSDLTQTEQMMFVGLFIMIVGTLAAWKWEVAGTFMIFAGFAVKWVAAGQYPAALYGLFPLAGFLYLIAWMLEHEPVAATAPAKVKKHGKKKKRGQASKA